MAWQKVKLGDICAWVASGGTPLTSKADYYSPKEIPWLKTQEVNYCRIYETNNQISKKGLENSSAKLIPANAVIVAMYGQGDTAGRVAINKIPLCTNQACCNLVIDENKADYEFVYYNLCTLYDKLVSLKNGGAQPNLNAGLIKNLEISLPPLSTQKRIADILSAYDDLIENNQKQIKLLEEAAQRLYKQWFIDLRFPGHETTKIVDGLPEGWKKEKFGDIVDYIRGTSYTSSELSDSDGVLMVNLKNINAFGGYKRNAEKRFTGKYKENGILEQGDLVMGCTDMTKERRLVGHVALIPNLKERAVFTMDLLKLLPKTISKTFLYAQCRFGGLSYKISPLANGANVLHLRPENMADIDVLCPSENVVESFDNAFASMISKIEKLEDQIQLAAESRDRLLPKLMNGELEV